ncbi:unnamed protein product [Lampetra planeri]
MERLTDRLAKAETRSRTQPPTMPRLRTSPGMRPWPQVPPRPRPSLRRWRSPLLRLRTSPAGLAAGAATGPYYTAATSAWPVEAATPPPFTASRECAVAAAVAPHLAAPVGWAAGAAVGPSYTAATSAWPVEAATPSLLAASREVSVAT